MNKLCQLADAKGQAMYLEAGGDSNSVFYKKFGFQVTHTMPFLNPEEPNAEPFYLHLMVRPALGKEVGKD